MIILGCRRGMYILTSKKCHPQFIMISKFWISGNNKNIVFWGILDRRLGGQVLQAGNCLRFAKPCQGGHERCEHGSDRREISAKHVSEDLQLSSFWRRICFSKKNRIFRIRTPILRYFRQILEHLGFFGRQNQVARSILLQIHQVIRSVRHLEPIFEAKNQNSWI